MDGLDPRLAALRDALPGQVLVGSGGVRYHLRERIGEGGQGWVFKANWDEPGGIVVIVKVLRPDVFSSETLARFQREAEVLRKLAQVSRPNPHIVRFFDHAVCPVASGRGRETVSLPFTVLEYVRGSNLERALFEAHGAGLAVERTRRILRQVVLALNDIHGQDIVHRDLKPSNILLERDGTTEVAKVTDFGLVKVVDVALQRTTALAGATLGYAPPEQYEQGNERVSPRTDVFSLAAILYEALSGHPAFPQHLGENPLVAIKRLVNDPRPSLLRMLSSLPVELRSRPDLVQQLDVHLAKAMAADPADRHESVQAFWVAVEPLLKASTESTLATPMQPGVGPHRAENRAEHRTARSAEPTDGTLPSAGVDANAASGASSSARASVPPPKRSAPTVAEDPRASNPAAWRWRVTTRGLRSGALRAARFVANGDAAIGVGPTGLTRWEGGHWTSLPTPEVDLKAVRGLSILPDGDVLLFGEGPVLGRVRAGGGFEPWNVPDPTVTFHGAHVDGSSGVVTLVGDRPTQVSPGRGPENRVASVAQFALDGRVTLAADVPASTRLRAVTRTPSGYYLACGDWGALVRIALGVPEFIASVCGGHLLALEVLPNGTTVTVGAGGHALSITSRLTPTLEAVQTTRDLLCLALGPDGAPWAGAAQARLVRRVGSSWVRMSGEVGLSCGIIAVSVPQLRRVVAICDDGSIIEGSLT